MLVVDVGGHPDVIVDIGVPNPDIAVLGDLLEGDVVAATGPVALMLDGHHQMVVLQSLPGLGRLIGLLHQVEVHHRRLLDENHAVGAVAVAVAAVPAAHLRRGQQLIGQIGGNHGHGGNAAAVGAQQEAAEHDPGIVLLQIQGDFREPLMSNVGIQKVRGGNRRLSFRQGNLVIGKFHGVGRPGLLQQVCLLGGKGLVRRRYLRFLQASGKIEDMNAVVIGNGRGIAALPSRVEAPGIQFGRKLPLLHPVIAAAIQG